MGQGLKGALELSGPEACLAYYRDWAANYDSGFAAAFMGTGAGGPVLDVGAGTGLLAESLRGMGFRAGIDAVDFSAEMLNRAAEKRLYDHLIRADITRPMDLPRHYAGIVSSGTFTAGHVGPEALPQLLAVALPRAQFALSINRRVWSDRGFDRRLEELSSSARITDLQLIEVEIYGAAAARFDADHAADRALIALFRAA